MTGSVIHPINPLTAISGVDLDGLQPKMSGGFKFVSGGPFKGPDDIMIDEYYARQNRKSVGDKINLLNRDWRMCGIIEAGTIGAADLADQGAAGLGRDGYEGVADLHQGGYSGECGGR